MNGGLVFIPTNIALPTDFANQPDRILGPLLQRNVGVDPKLVLESHAALPRSELAVTHEFEGLTPSLSHDGGQFLLLGLTDLVHLPPRAPSKHLHLSFETLHETMPGGAGSLLLSVRGDSAPLGSAEPIDPWLPRCASLGVWPATLP